jgi:hypothetical protein
MLITVRFLGVADVIEKQKKLIDQSREMFDCLLKSIRTQSIRTQD